MTASLVWPQALTLLGAGKMGAALLEGWLKAGMQGSAITIIDPYISDHVTELAIQHGCTVNPSSGADFQCVVVLAVKPQMLGTIQLDSAIDTQTLIISIMAGKTVGDVQKHLPAARSVVRAMPNTPASIGKGISGAFASSGVSTIHRVTAQHLLEAVGEVVWLEKEADIDAVTAVSGSGPAYVFYMVECMAKAGEAAGLLPEVAMRLARLTVEGAGYLLGSEQNQSASELRINVTSPHGTTAAALNILMGNKELEVLMTRAILAAKHRAGELSG